MGFPTNIQAAVVAGVYIVLLGAIRNFLPVELFVKGEGCPISLGIMKVKSYTLTCYTRCR